MVRADAALWELSCVVPSQHGELGDLIVRFGHTAGGFGFLNGEAWGRTKPICSAVPLLY